MDDKYALGLFNLGYAYSMKGMHREAIQALCEASRISGGYWSYWLAAAYARAGQTDEAPRMLAEFEAQPVTPWSAFGLAVANAALGNNDAAFRWLEFRMDIPHRLQKWISIASGPAAASALMARL